MPVLPICTRTIDKTIRSVLLRCMEHLPEIEQWRQALPVSKILDLNHPRTVWRAWQTTAKPVKPREPKKTAKQKELERVRDYVTELESGREALKEEIKLVQNRAMGIAGKLTRVKKHNSELEARLETEGAEVARTRARIVELEAMNARLRQALMDAGVAYGQV